MKKYTYVKENILSNTVTVIDDNGNKLHINKDEYLLNEGIISDAYRKIKTGVLSLIKKGRGVLSVVGDKILGYLSPINAAVSPVGVVVLSDNLVEEANELGVAVEQFDFTKSLNKEYNIEDSDDANKYWSRYIIHSYIENKNKIKRTDESVVDDMLYKHIRAVYEATVSGIGRTMSTHSPFDLSSDSKIPNFNRKKLIQVLKENMASVLDKGYNENSRRPLLIWGAPGIGKTDLIKQIVAMIQKHSKLKNFTSIYLTASNVFPEDFMLPTVIDTQDTKEIQKSVDVALQTPKGKEVTDKWLDNISRYKAVDLPKPWLPVYPIDPNDNTINKQRSEALGYGVLFIDEFSRIPPQTRHVLMTLVQQRELNGYAIGDGWVIVSASNRASDIGDNKMEFVWETAWGGRFEQCNYSPEFKEWLEWAERINEDTNRPNVWPVITKYLREFTNEWYDLENKGDLLADGRNWAELSKAYYSLVDLLNNGVMSSLFGDDEEIPKDVNPELGVEYDRLSNTIDVNVGTLSGGKFKEYVKTNYIDFNDKDGKNSWENPNLITIDDSKGNASASLSIIIDRIVRNYPGDGVVNFTPKEFDNVINSLDKIYGKASLKSEAVKQLKTKIVNDISNKKNLTAAELFSIENGRVLKETAKMISSYNRGIETTN